MTDSREEQAQRSREHIIETALHLFAEHGYNGTSTRKIAQAAAITEGLIFHYFPTKAHLLAAVMETRHSFLNELRGLLNEAQGQPAADVLPEIARGWLATLRRERAITSLMLATAQTNADVNAALQDAIQEGVGRLADYLRTRVDAGELRADLPVHHSALAFYSSLLVFFLSHRHLSDTVWDAEAETYADNVVSLWLDGATI